MAKIFYGNSSNVPKNISAMFIGNSSRPRLIKKIYIGDSSNKPKLCYEDASGLVSVTYNLSSSSITSSSSNPLYVDPNSISSTTPLLLTFDIQGYSAEIPIFIQIQDGAGRFTESITGDENTGLGSLTVNITSVNPTQPIDVKISLSKYIPAGCYVLSPQLTSNGQFSTMLSEEPLHGATILTRSNNSGSYNFYSVDSITVDSEGLKYNLFSSDSEYPCCGYSTYASAHSGYNNLWGYWDDTEHWGYSDIELNTLMFEADTEVSDALYDFLFNNPAEVLFQPAIHWGVYIWNTTDIQGGLEGYNLWYQVKPDDPQMKSSYNAGMLMTKLASSFEGGPIHYINEETGADFEAMSTSPMTPDDILIPFTQVVTPDLKEFLSQNLTMYSNYTGNTTSSQPYSFEVIKNTSYNDYRLYLHFDPFSSSTTWSIDPNNLTQYQPIDYGSISFESVLIEVEKIDTNENQTGSGYFAFQCAETSDFNEGNVSYNNGSLKWRWGNIFIPSIFDHSYLSLYLDD